MISPTIPRGSRILPIKNLGRWLNVLHSTRWPWWPCADWCLQPDGMANQRLFRYDPVRFRQLLQHAGLLPHLGVPDQDNLLQAFETRLDQLVAMWEANDPSATRTTTPFPKFKHQPRRTMALKWLMEVNNIGAGGMSWGNFNGTTLVTRRNQSSVRACCSRTGTCQLHSGTSTPLGPISSWSGWRNLPIPHSMGRGPTPLTASTTARTKQRRDSSPSSTVSPSRSVRASGKVGGAPRHSFTGT